MTKLNVREIQELAKKIIAQHPGGIRNRELVDRIRAAAPETNLKTIAGAIWKLPALYPNEIIKPSRGVFKPATEGAAAEAAEPVWTGTPGGPAARVSEGQFYQPFADWLKNELDEVTEVAALGGNVLKYKWGTPDVLGVYKPLARDLVKFPLELLAGEVKTDPAAPVVAFGQAVAYRLFAAKTYIAMPSTTAEEDLGRLEALCMLFGVGLVLFDLDVNNPNFSIRVRAQRFSPDMFYVNELADSLKKYNAEVFEQLFG